MSAGHALHFSALPLDRRDDRRGDAAWLRAQWERARLLLLDGNGDVLVDAAGALRTVGAADLAADAFERACFLGVGQDGQAWFALSLLAGDRCPGDDAGALQWLGLRSAASRWPAFDSGLFAYARALALWRARSRFCGGCGAPTLPARGGHSMRCGAAGCGWEQFPRMDPAVIVLVTDGTRCLLGRQAGWPPRQYSTLAGFVEPGESLEDALVREVAEESGVRVANCRYQFSQPWPFPSSLMLGFRAEAADPAIRIGTELEDVRWFDIDRLLADVAGGALRPSTPVSISFRLLHDWVGELRGSDAAAGLVPSR